MLSSVISAEIKVMSFNIRYYDPKEILHSWSVRKNAVLNVIKDYSPDILGTQEEKEKQVVYLKENLKSRYVYFGRPRDKKQKSLANGIFYRFDRFEQIWGDFFWLSEFPEEEGSKGWDAASVRLCTAIVLKDTKTEDLILTINCHFDHKGKQARIESSRLVLSQIEKITSEFGIKKVILIGDLNAKEDTKPISTLKTSLTSASEGDNTYTFHDFRGGVGLRKIDYIFYSGFSSSNYSVITDTYWLILPSDHYPIQTTLN